MRTRIKETWKSALLALSEGNSPVIGEFPAQRASNAEKASIWWRRHDMLVTSTGATGIILADQMNPLQRIHHYKIIPSSMESDSNHHLRPVPLKIKCFFYKSVPPYSKGTLLLAVYMPYEPKKMKCSYRWSCNLNEIPKMILTTGTAFCVCITMTS